MAKIMLPGWRCERGGHEWAPPENGEVEPRVCPKCKNPYWNRPRTADAPVKKKPKGK